MKFTKQITYRGLTFVITVKSMDRRDNVRIIIDDIHGLKFKAVKTSTVDNIGVNIEVLKKKIKPYVDRFWSENEVMCLALQENGFL